MSASKVLMIQNDEIETFGLYEKYLKEREIDHRILHAYRIQHHESFPSVENYDAFIIGPTPISANDIDVEAIDSRNMSVEDKRCLLDPSFCLTIDEGKDKPEVATKFSKELEDLIVAV